MAGRMSTRMIVVRGLGTALAFALGAGGAAYAVTADDAPSRQSATTTGNGSSVPVRLPVGPSTSEDATSAATTASAEQVEGVVYLDSTVAGGTAAGTGMVLSSDGTVLTNYHVVEGATAIEAQDVTTGRTYDATIVGYDAENDVAVLRLEDASGLQTVTTDTSGDLAVGDAVVGVGDAGGDKGTASAAAGTVTALDRSVSVRSDSGQATEQLRDMIEVAADIRSGDSGGPLYDADGEVVGMDTAASSGSADVTGYAIPIARALDVVEQVESGTSSGSVVVGSPGFLGVAFGDGSSQGEMLAVPDADGTSGSDRATVEAVVEGSAAEQAGITAGSTITGLDGNAVTSPDDVSAAVAEHAAGDAVAVTWVDASGASHSTTVTLGSAA